LLKMMAIIFNKRYFPAENTRRDTKKGEDTMVRKRRAESVAYDKEEEKLMASVENEEWISVDNLEEEIEKAQAVARATFKKSERMNIRISQKDLNGLKVRAMEEGIPYQTLVSSIIHKYLSGRLMEP